MSIQIGWPEGASAEWPSDMPSASPTTCEVAAVPRNWHPPPGDAQARHPRSAASSSVTAPCTNRTPSVCTFPASSPCSGISVTPPGTRHGGEIVARCERHHHRRQSFVARGDAEHATPRRQRSNQPAEHSGRVVAERQAVEHRRGALRSAVARIRARRRKRNRAGAFEHTSRGLQQQPHLPVTGVIPERDWRPIRRADTAVRRRASEIPCRRARLGSSPCRRSASSRTNRRTAARATFAASMAAHRSVLARVWRHRRVEDRRNRMGSWPWVYSGVPGMVLLVHCPRPSRTSVPEEFQ